MNIRDSMDRRFKEKEWRVDRAVWAVLAVGLLLAGLGLFGGGWIAREHVSLDEDGARYTMRYEDFNRRDHVSTLLVVVEAPGTEGDELGVTFSPGLVQGITVRSSVPSADGGALGQAGATYTFKVDDWSDPLVVSFEYLPEDLGDLRGHIGIKAGDRDAQALLFRHFVYP